MNINRNTGSKWTALAIAVAAIVMSPFEGTGICEGCSWIARLTYPMFHANLIHAISNAWCLVTVVFLYDLPWWKIAIAYLIAVSVPTFALSTTPAVGMSGVCFALMGLSLPSIRRKLFFNAWVACFLAVGVIMPGVAWKVHLYCYITGWLVGDFIEAIS